jgi:hypothetical protein
MGIHTPKLTDNEFDAVRRLRPRDTVWKVNKFFIFENTTNIKSRYVPESSDGSGLTAEIVLGSDGERLLTELRGGGSGALAPFEGMCT